MAYLPAEVNVVSRLPAIDTQAIQQAGQAPIQGALQGLQLVQGMGLTKEQLQTAATRIAANNAKNQNTIQTMPGLTDATNAENLAKTQLAPSDTQLKLAQNASQLGNVAAQGNLTGLELQNKTAAASRVANAGPTLDDIYANEQLVAKKNAATQAAIVDDQNDAQKSKATLDALLAGQTLSNNSVQDAILKRQLSAQLADAADAPARAIALQNAKIELAKNQSLNQKAQADYNEWYRGMSKTNQDPKAQAIAEIAKLDQDDKLTDYAQVTNPKTGKDTYEDANGNTKPYRLTDYRADTRTAQGTPTMQNNVKVFHPSTWGLPDSQAPRDETAEKLMDHKKLNDLLRQSYMSLLQAPAAAAPQSLRPGNLPLPASQGGQGLPQLQGPQSLLSGQGLAPSAATQQSTIAPPSPQSVGLQISPAQMNIMAQRAKSLPNGDAMIKHMQDNPNDPRNAAIIKILTGS